MGAKRRPESVDAISALITSNVQKGECTWARFQPRTLVTIWHPVVNCGKNTWAPSNQHLRRHLGISFPLFSGKMAVLSSPLGLILSVPPVTRAFTGATIVFSALYGYLSWKGMDLEASNYMTVVPGYAFYAPWTLLTSAFVEVTIWEASISIFRVSKYR